MNTMISMVHAIYFLSDCLPTLIGLFSVGVDTPHAESLRHMQGMGSS